jgi:NADH-quinone oxidoreductase subunit E
MWTGEKSATMLTEEERKEIRDILDHAPVKRAAAIDVLKAVQRRRRYISDETLRDVAPELGMSPDQLDGIATFYSLIFRRPVGRHVILVCDSISCWVLRSNRLFDALTARLRVKPGETTADGRFTLLPAACLGACDRAPVIMIDGDLHGPVTPEELDGILEGYQ